MENDNLSDEEKKILHEMKKNWEIEKEKEKLFWVNEYRNYTFEEKVSYWSGTLHRQMRWQAESGLDEYAIYNKNWYNLVKEIEPDIDKIIDLAFEKFLSWEWSKEEYLKRIKE